MSKKDIDIKEFIRDYAKITKITSDNINDVIAEIKGVISITDSFKKKEISDDEIKKILLSAIKEQNRESRRIFDDIKKVVKESNEVIDDNIKNYIKDKTDYVIGDQKEVIQIQKNLFTGFFTFLKSGFRGVFDSITSGDLRQYFVNKYNYVMGDDAEIINLMIGVYKTAYNSFKKRFSDARKEQFEEEKSYFEDMKSECASPYTNNDATGCICDDLDDIKENTAGTLDTLTDYSDYMKNEFSVDNLKAVEFTSSAFEEIGDCVCNSLEAIKEDTSAIVDMMSEYIGISDDSFYDINETLDDIYDLNKREFLANERLRNKKSIIRGLFEQFLIGAAIGVFVGTIIGKTIKQFGILSNIMGTFIKWFKNFSADMKFIGRGFQKVFTFWIRQELVGIYSRFEFLIMNNVRRLFNVQRLWNTTWNKAIDFFMDVTNHINILLERIKKMIGNERLTKIISFIEDFFVDVRASLLKMRRSSVKSAALKNFFFEFRTLVNDYLIKGIEDSLKGMKKTKGILAGFFERVPITSLLRFPKFTGLVAGIRHGIETLGPKLLGITAIMDFVSGWLDSTKKDFFGKLQDATKKMTKNIIEFPIRVVTWITEKFINFIHKLIYPWKKEEIKIHKTIMEGVDELLDSFAGTIIALYKTLQTFFPQMSSSYTGITDKALSAIKSYVKKTRIYKKIASEMLKIQNMITSYFGKIGDVIKGFLSSKKTGPSAIEKVIKVIKKSNIYKHFRYGLRMATYVVKKLVEFYRLVIDKMAFASNFVKNIDLATPLMKFFDIFHAILDSVNALGDLRMVGKSFSFLESILNVFGKAFKFIGSVAKVSLKVFAGIFKVFTPFTRLLGWFSKFIPGLNILVSIFSFIKGFAESEGGFIEKALNGLKAVLMSFLELPIIIIGWIGKLFGFDNLKETLMNAVNALLDAIIGFIVHPIDTIKSMFTGDGMLSKVLSFVVKYSPLAMMYRAWKWIVDKILGYLFNINVNDVIDFIKEYNPITLMYKAVKWMFGKVFDIISSISDGVFNFIKEYNPITLIYRSIKWYFGKIGDYISDIASGVWDTIKQYNPITLLSNLFGSIFDKIGEYFNENKDKNPILLVINSVYDGIMGFFNIVAELFDMLVNHTRDLLNKVTFGLVDSEEEKRQKEKEKKLKEQAYNNIDYLFKHGYAVDDWGANPINDKAALEKFSAQELRGILKYGNWETDTENMLKQLIAKKEMKNKKIKSVSAKRNITNAVDSVTEVKMKSKAEELKEVSKTNEILKKSIKEQKEVIAGIGDRPIYVEQKVDTEPPEDIPAFTIVAMNKSYGLG